MEEKNELVEKRIATVEDIERMKNQEERKKLEENPIVQRIIKYKKQGMSDTAISEMPDIPWKQGAVSRYTRKCKSFGLLTDEDMKEIEEQNEKRRKEEQRRRLEANSTVQKILMLKRQLMTDDEISIALVDVTRRRVSNYIQECIEVDLITELELKEIREKRKQRNREIKSKEIERAREKAKEEKEKSEENQLSFEIEQIDEEQLLSYLVLGDDKRTIKKKMGISDNSQYEEAIDKLEKENKITKQKIKYYREKRRKEDKAKVLRCLRQGISNEKMEKMFDSTSKRIRTYIKEVKEENNISDEDIKKWKQERKSREACQLTDDEEVVRRYKEEAGYSVKEIAILIGSFESSVERKLVRIKQVQKAKEEKAQRFNQIKREINNEVKFVEKDPSEEKAEQIKEYIDLCFLIHKDKQMEKLELEFLEKAIRKVPIEDNNVIKFIKKCITMKQYTKALNMVRYRNNGQRLRNSEYGEKTFEELELGLVKACNVEKAIRLIKENGGNINADVISDITGISEEEANILKLKTRKTPINFLTITQRKQVIEALLKDRERHIDIMQRQLGINDFETADIKKQIIEYRMCNISYKNLEEQKKEELEKKIEQDCRVRTIVLYTKIGKKPEYIAEKLEVEPSVIEEDLETAVKENLIQSNQLNGINPLVCKIPRLKPLEL